MTASRHLTPWSATLPPSRSKQLLRRAIHLLSYHFILKRRRTTVARVAGFRLTGRPTVFHPPIFSHERIFRKLPLRYGLNRQTGGRRGNGIGHPRARGSPGRSSERSRARHQPQRREGCSRKCPRQWPRQTDHGGGFEPALGAYTAPAV